MNKIDDELAAVKTALDDTNQKLAVVGTGITGLQTQITALNAKIASFPVDGSLTDAQQAALDAIKTEAGSVSANVDSMAAQFTPAPAPTGGTA